MSKRLVRLHFREDGTPSLEGLLCGYRTHRSGNHYVLGLVKVIKSADESYTLDGETVRVPRERVAFIQELS